MKVLMPIEIILGIILAILSMTNVVIILIFETSNRKWKKSTVKKYKRIQNYIIKLVLIVAALIIINTTIIFFVTNKIHSLHDFINIINSKNKTNYNTHW